MTAAIDLTAPYALAADLVVAQRNSTTVQIGTDEPRRVIITGVSRGTADTLRELDRSPSLGDAISALGPAHLWLPLLRTLIDSGMLVRRGTGTAAELPLPVRLELTHRFGPVLAARLLTARLDATVTVEGSGPVADSVAWILDDAGVGRIYRMQPRRRGSLLADAHRQPLAAARFGAGRAIRHGNPASQIRPTVAVLVGAASVVASRAARLVADRVPHLPLGLTAARAVVGPLVLPGRSACLNCLDKHRTDADPEWSAVAELPAQRPCPPIAAHLAAGAAAHQVLELIDGTTRPVSVGSTIEYAAGSIQPGLRTWSLHPRCGCHNDGM